MTKTQYHKWAKANLAKGLTAHGKVRQRRAKLTEQERRQYNTAKFRLRSQRLYDLGLTTRGTKRKRWVKNGQVLGEVHAIIGRAVANCKAAKANAEKLATQLQNEKQKP